MCWLVIAGVGAFVGFVTLLSVLIWLVLSDDF